MAETGLLPFARSALQICRGVLPRYRSRFSRRQFTQPQLLAVLCLMQYEDWTFREAKVRLGEHRGLRHALGFSSVPDLTTLYRFLQRLDDLTIDRAVGETVRRLRGTRQKGRRCARVAVDATGLAQGAASTFLVRRMHHQGEKPLDRAALAEEPVWKLARTDFHMPFQFSLLLKRIKVAASTKNTFCGNRGCHTGSERGWS